MFSPWPEQDKPEALVRFARLRSGRTRYIKTGRCGSPYLRPNVDWIAYQTPRFIGDIRKDHYSVPPDNIVTLLDAQATRTAVVNAFRTHLGKARKDDLAVFFYAGHGLQEPTSSYDLPIEPDGKNETIVCHDSRQTRQIENRKREPGHHIALQQVINDSMSLK